MPRKRRCALVVLGFILPITAQSLSLSESLELSLKENFDVSISKQQADSFYFDIMEKNSAFDWGLLGTSEYTDKTDEALSTILSATRERNWNSKLSLTKKFLWGTQIEAAVGVTRSDSNLASLSVNPSWDTTLTFGLKHPFLQNFFGYSDRNTVLVAELKSNASDKDSLRNIEVTLSNVEKSYWLTVYSIKNLEIKKESLQRAVDLLVSHEKKIKSGLIEETQLLMTRAHMEIQQSQVKQAQKEMAAARASFLALFKKGLSDDFIPEDELDFEEYAIPNMQDALERAQSKRMDLISSKLSLEETQTALSLSKNKLLPQLDIVAKVTGNGLDRSIDNGLGESVEYTFPTYVVGVEFTVPLNNRFDRAAFHKAHASRISAEEIYLKNLQKVRQDLNTSHESLIRSQQIVHSSEKVEQLQERKLKLEQDNFKRGRSSTDRVIDFQEDLLEAQGAALDAILQYQFALIDWHLAQGDYLDQKNIEMKFQR
ncbi:MAG: TolC family protein [Deltaproteobacteria bacterium]|nr:TolC family protein [Deltaproteobacteria bacterium]